MSTLVLSNILLLVVTQTTFTSRSVLRTKLKVIMCRKPKLVQTVAILVVCALLLNTSWPRQRARQWSWFNKTKGHPLFATSSASLSPQFAKAIERTMMVYCLTLPMVFVTKASLLGRQPVQGQPRKERKNLVYSSPQGSYLLISESVMCNV